MRKFLALLMAVLLLGTLSFAAFAKGQPDRPDDTTEAPVESTTDYPSPTTVPVVTVIYPDNSRTTIPINTAVPGFVNVPREQIDILIITGQFTVVPGEDDGMFTLIANSDLSLRLPDTPTEPSDTSPVSPPTGAPSSNTGHFWLIAVIVLAAVFGVAFTAKKFIKTR